MPPAGYRPPVRECAAHGCPRPARVSRQLCSKHARLHAKRKALVIKEGRCLGHIPRDLKLELKAAASLSSPTNVVEVPSHFDSSSSSSSSLTRRSPRETKRNVKYNLEDDDDYSEEGEDQLSYSESEEDEDTLTMDTYTVSIQHHKSVSSSPSPSHQTTPAPSRLPSPCASPSPSSAFFIPLPTTSPLSIDTPITKEKRRYRKKNKTPSEGNPAEKLQALTEAVLEAVATDFDLQAFEASVLARRNSISNQVNLWAAIPQLSQSQSSCSAPLSPPTFSSCTSSQILGMTATMPTRLLPSISSFVPMFHQSSHITLCNPTAASTTTIALDRGVSAM